MFLMSTKSALGLCFHSEMNLSATCFHVRHSWWWKKKVTISFTSIAAKQVKQFYSRTSNIIHFYQDFQISRLLQHSMFKVHVYKTYLRWMIRFFDSRHIFKCLLLHTTEIRMCKCTQSTIFLRNMRKYSQIHFHNLNDFNLHYTNRLSEVNLDFIMYYYCSAIRATALWKFNLEFKFDSVEELCFVFFWNICEKKIQQ